MSRPSESNNTMRKACAISSLFTAALLLVHGIPAVASESALPLLPRVQEFHFSIPFGPAVKTITPEAPPPQTVINLTSPPAPVCPLPVIQPEEPVTAAPLSIRGTINSAGTMFDLAWSCSGYAGGCAIAKNGQSYLFVDGDGILNGIPLDHFPAGTPVSQAQVVIEIRSGSVSDQWSYTGIIDAAPVSAPIPPVKGSGYAVLENKDNLWFKNQDALVPGSLISDTLPLYDAGHTLGADQFLTPATGSEDPGRGAMPFGSLADESGIVRLRSSFEVKPGETLWKELKKYKLQYSYGAGWGAMASNPGAPATSPTAQAFFTAFNTFKNRAYNSNCGVNPDTEWFDVGIGGVKYFNNPVTKDKTVPVQTLYGPDGTPEAYAESQPFTTHNKDEAPGQKVMLDFPLQVVNFVSSPVSRDRLHASDTYPPSGTSLWTQKIADALCFRMVQEDGKSDSVRYLNFPVIWKDGGSFYAPGTGAAQTPQPANAPSLSITNLHSGDVIAATGYGVSGELNTAVTNQAVVNFKVNGTLSGPAYEYRVSGKVYNHPDSVPPAPHQSNDTFARILSPAPYQVFLAGNQNKIYWSGGAGSIGLVLFSGQTYTAPAAYNPLAISTYAPSTPIGWIAKNLGPNGEILWDAKTICDINGATCQPLSKFGTGPFFIGVVQQHIEKSVAVSTDSGWYSTANGITLYNGSPSGTYFNVPQAGPFFVEQTANTLPRITAVEHDPCGIGTCSGQGDFSTGPGYIYWNVLPGDYAFELALVDKNGVVLSRTKAENLDAGIPRIAVTSPAPGAQIDVNKPLTVRWTANKYVDPEAPVTLTLRNYPDTGYYNFGDDNQQALFRYVYYRHPPRSGIDAVGPELGWARFIYKGVAKAKDGQYIYDPKTLPVWVSYQGPAGGCVTNDSYRIAQGLMSPAELQNYRSPVSVKDCIKTLGNFDTAFLNISTSNDPLYHYATTSAGSPDYSHLIADHLPSNASGWTPQVSVRGPVIDVPPPSGNERITVTSPVRNGILSENQFVPSPAIAWTTAGTYTGFTYKTHLEDTTIANVAEVPDAASPETQVKIVNPVERMVFTYNGQNKISWKGGWDRVIVGIAQKGFSYNASPNSVIGYITRNAKPNSFILWDGKTVCDESGSNCHDLRQAVTTVLYDSSGNAHYGVTQAILPGDFEIFVISRGQITVNDQGPQYCYNNVYCNIDHRPVSIEATPNQLSRKVADTHTIGTLDAGATPYTPFRPAHISASDQHTLVATLIDENGRTVATDTVPFIVGDTNIKIVAPLAGNFDVNQPLTVRWDTQRLDPAVPVSIILANRPDPEYMFNKWVNWTRPFPATPPVDSVTFKATRVTRPDGTKQTTAMSGDGQAVIDLRDTIKLTQNWISQPVPGSFVTLGDYLRIGGALNNLYVVIVPANNPYATYFGDKMNDAPFTSFAVTGTPLADSGAGSFIASFYHLLFK